MTDKEIIKRLREQFKLKDYTTHDNCELLIDEDALFDDIEDFILSELQKTVNDIVKLSEDIENSHDHTELNEWKAFKQFRNTLRDKYLKVK